MGGGGSGGSGGGGGGNGGGLIGLHVTVTGWRTAPVPTVVHWCVPPSAPEAGPVMNVNKLSAQLGRKLVLPADAPVAYTPVADTTAHAPDASFRTCTLVDVVLR